MTTTNVNSAERKIVTFTLSNRIFGIDMSALIEIREWEEPTPLPGVPGYIKGVANLRGTVIPIIGLAERLGWEPSVPHARSCILVVVSDGKQAGFLVDEVADIVSISENQVQPAPDIDLAEPGVVAGLVKAQTRAQQDASDEGAMVLLLDLDALNVTRQLDLAA
ncbi:chemotaxis protein CheW [Sphingomonas changnyeongensis]|uniref:Chemotaxis protein CheW n=1 Tax=Sphingomonas changnyeongensis TaxID=2698679 RepID=A0A7Z2NUQ5_9SPHN|nr:chemotaxis protein CheW [Sphingomonas changnyeongensis]QHL89769.1 chemotaxis protein CheW [Sphingomonas changnyeongensis]